jgi:3-keto-disaccharide hydrolase
MRAFISRTSLLLFLVSATILRAEEPLANSLTDAEKGAGWKLLFDGKTTAGWKNFKKETVGPGWKVEDGTLVRKEGGAGDILTVEQYDAFELVLEYNISKGGNSGLMFHVTETAQTPWMTGPEIQIQDNKDGHDPQKSGWLYQLYSSEKDATRPAGEWNQLRILITPEKCQHFMNGEKYCEYVKGSDDWNERVAKSKFAKMPEFGKPTKGHICLQDHGNLVAFRNVKIRPIAKKAE